MVSWDISVRRALWESELVERQSLLSLLTNVFLSSDSTDYRIWKPNSAGLFSLRSFYKEIGPFSATRSCCEL